MCYVCTYVCMYALMDGSRVRGMYVWIDLQTFQNENVRMNINIWNILHLKRGGGGVSLQGAIDGQKNQKNFNNSLTTTTTTTTTTPTPTTTTMGMHLRTVSHRAMHRVHRCTVRTVHVIMLRNNNQMCTFINLEWNTLDQTICTNNTSTICPNNICK